MTSNPQSLYHTNLVFSLQNSFQTKNLDVNGSFHVFSYTLTLCLHKSVNSSFVFKVPFFLYRFKIFKCEFKLYSLNLFYFFNLVCFQKFIIILFCIYFK